MSAKSDIFLHELLSNLLHDVTGLRISDQTTFDEIGLQSLSVVSLTNKLDAYFPNLPKAFLFDCQNISEVAAYLKRRYPDETHRLMPSGNGQGHEVSGKSEVEDGQDGRGALSSAADRQNDVGDDGGWEALEVLPVTATDTGAQHHDIAIVGMQGRFPGADDLATFWKNLTDGVDTVATIPSNRWSLDGFYAPSDQGRQPGRSYSKSGAFLNDVEMFDAKFFGIASREAVVMDPQERIFLQVAWQAMESAGLFGERALDLRTPDGFDVGVFLGLTTNTYLLHGPEMLRRGSGDIPASMPWSAANRVSFCLDFCGPSLTVDTACSSSLVAIHLACESLRNAECSAAIAGGVNLYLHPAKYIQLCQQQMLSPTGRCHSFGAAADGFAPGEGAGALVLKRMQDALRDNDQILAVIRGTAVNHNGRTNGYTVPRARSQAALVKTALRSGEIDPASITYVEAHGTGTKLGDPIEVAGLSEALGGKALSPCGLGSVKTNIGHLESAAGVAGVIKTVLQLQHKCLAPSLHSEQLNPALELDQTRFFVPQAVQPWVASGDVPRRAGVSSFGAGGANGHVVVEEAPASDPAANVAGPMVFLLSARSLASLAGAVKSLLAYLEALPEVGGSQILARVAYTLQCGRKHFEHRLAFVSDDRVDLLAQLRSHVAHGLKGAGTSGPFSGHVIESKDDGSQSGDLSPARLGMLWTEGVLVSWQRRWHPHPPMPINAPLYDFDEERHQLAGLHDTVDADADVDVVPVPVPVQPPRDNDGVITIAADDSVLQQHRIGGHSLLPATAYIAHMQALALARGVGTELRNLAWLRPVTAGAGQAASLSYRSFQVGDTWQFEFSRDDDGKLCFSGHAADVSSATIATRHDGIVEARRRCPDEIDVADCYQTFAQAGMMYGPRFQCLKQAWKGPGEVVSRVKVQHASHSDNVSTPLDPAVLDATLHAAVFLLNEKGISLSTPLVPVGARRVRVLDVLTKEVFSVIRMAESEDSRDIRFDVQIYAPDGRPLIEIEGFVYHKLETSHKPASQDDVVSIRREWIEVERDPARLEAAVSQLVFGLDAAGWQKLNDEAPAVASSTLAARHDAAFEVRDNCILWDSSNTQHLELLWRSVAAIGPDVSRLVFVIDPTADQGFARIGFNGDLQNGTGLEAIEIIRSFAQAHRSRRVDVCVLVEGIATGETGLASALGSLLRSVNLEIPTLSGAVVEVVDGDMASAVSAELRLAPWPGVRNIRRQAGHYVQRRLVPATSRANAPRFSSDDVFVVTGASGAIARRLAHVLARNGVGGIALLSRSARSPDIDTVVRDLQKHGAKVGYWQADCSDETALGQALAEAVAQLGPVTGVLHCAGVLHDGFFVRQSVDDLRSSCRAKVQGAYLLDKLTTDTPLKWFAVCSAMAGIFGNVGQAHYALANAWLDRFAEDRHLKVDRGDRQGQSVAIAWPFWDTSDGMQASERLRAALQSAGIQPINDGDGEDIFLRALGGSAPMVIPLKGETEAISRFCDDYVSSAMSPITSERRADPTPLPAAADAALGDDDVDDAEIAAALLEYLRATFHKVTGADPERIDFDAPMEVFGLDSIMVTELNAHLETRFPSASKTLAFEARNLRALAQTLLGEHAADAAKFAPPRPSRAGALAANTIATPPVAVARTDDLDDATSNDIAIIGLAGEYPGSRSLDEFWQHLADGDDLVGGLPRRWRDAPFGFSTPGQDHRIYARWGSFLEDFDKFDPLFFGISPRDAERMDPQERLFLQTAWHAVENAGYSPELLSGGRDRGTDRQRVGVIVGVMYGEYQFYGAGADNDDSVPLTSSSYASIANRVSFCLDLDGPSFAVDSMCSSSLYALHLATELIRAGSCDLAIAGGVNLSLHPYKYRTLSELNFASSDGKCRSFGAGGDGYVPGEGVGAVLLKPLKAAVRDRDHIHGVIRGSDIGHGGRGTGYTVPNADSQADVIRRAFARSGVEQNRLSYIEAHGTGTSLGDPIEIRGLSKAFASQSMPMPTCAIGSIKSNIGHLESAAGIAGLTKVLLQFKHKKIAPSLHASELNHNIDFSKTPFSVQRTLADWPTRDGQPRLAALSSFGAGGSNAHLVVEEHVPQSAIPAFSGNEQMFVFSARNWKQLDAVLANHCRYLQVEENQDVGDGEAIGERRYRPEEVASTLLHGRVANRCRCAIVASNFVALREHMEGCRSRLEHSLPEGGSKVGDDAYLGEVQSPSEHDAAAQSLRQKAQAWVVGKWSNAVVPQGTRKVPLPGYVFERRSFWIWDLDAEAGLADVANAPVDAMASPTQPPDPDVIIQMVERGELNIDDAQELLQRLIEAEAAE